MVERPWLMVDDFRAPGAHVISVHLEAAPQTREVLRQIRATGAKAGLAIKPGTPYAAVAPYLPDLDVFLVMTVEPGFGGQAFMSEMLDKVTAARAEREKKNLGFLIEVDGGIAEATARTARAAGGDVFVAGNASYRSHAAHRGARRAPGAPRGGRRVRGGERNLPLERRARGAGGARGGDRGVRSGCGMGD